MSTSSVAFSLLPLIFFEAAARVIACLLPSQLPSMIILNSFGPNGRVIVLLAVLPSEAISSAVPAHSLNVPAIFASWKAEVAVIVSAPVGIISESFTIKTVSFGSVPLYACTPVIIWSASFGAAATYNFVPS